MTVENRRGRRALAAAAALIALTATACSSSGGVTGGAGSSASTSTSASSSTAASTSASSSASSTASKPVAGANKAACADVQSLIKINKAFDAAGNDLNKGKALLGSLVGTSDKLVKDAPSSLAAPAKTYDKDARVLAAATVKAKSITALHKAATSDPKLRGAVTELGTMGGSISAWSAKNC